MFAANQFILLMQTYSHILYQVVFSTRFREPTLTADVRPRLFAYIRGHLKKRRCEAYAVGGVADHIHLVFRLHPSVALADLIRDIKVASTGFLKSLPDEAPDYVGWQHGYAAFTYTRDCRSRLVKYVSNQEALHARRTAAKELRMLLAAHQVEYDEQYFA